MPPPSGNTASLRDYQSSFSLNHLLIRPYFLGAVALGGYLDSYDKGHPCSRWFERGRIFDSSGYEDIVLTIPGWLGEKKKR